MHSIMDHEETEDNRPSLDWCDGYLELCRSRSSAHDRGLDVSPPADSNETIQNGLILVVGPIPRDGNYIGGIGVFLTQLLEKWCLPYSVAHFNLERQTREYATTGRLSIRNCGASLVTWFQLGRAVRRTRPVLVHYHTSRQLALVKDMLIAAWVRRCCRVKVVMHVHCSDINSLLLARCRGVRRLQLRGLRSCCDRIILLSHNVLSDFVGVLKPPMAGELRSQCAIMPNFTGIPDLSIRDGKARCHVNLFFIGNVGSRKGVYDILRVAARLKGVASAPFGVTVAGPFDSAAEERRMRTAVEDLGVSDVVSFLGTVYGEEKDRAFREADVFVLPSYSEGVPLSMLEAMSYGIPVVVSDVGGIPEIVRDGVEGVVVKPGDTDGLLRALARLVDSPSDRRVMGRAARARIVASHTVENYMRQLEGLYASVLSRQDE